MHWTALRPPAAAEVCDSEPRRADETPSCSSSPRALLALYDGLLMPSTAPWSFLWGLKRWGCYFFCFMGVKGSGKERRIDWIWKPNLDALVWWMLVGSYLKKVSDQETTKWQLWFQDVLRHTDIYKAYSQPVSLRWRTKRRAPTAHIPSSVAADAFGRVLGQRCRSPKRGS